MKPILSWVKQPTTLLALAIATAGITYWLTHSAGLAAAVAAAILGGMNDHTRDLLARVEALEDAARPAVAAASASAATPATAAASAVMTALGPLTAMAIAVVLNR